VVGCECLFDWYWPAGLRAGQDLAVFADPSTRSMLAADLTIVSALDQQIKRLEAELVRTAKVHDLLAFHRLRTVPGIGPRTLRR
jgi:hypothetical protein